MWQLIVRFKKGFHCERTIEQWHNAQTMPTKWKSQNTEDMKQLEVYCLIFIYFNFAANINRRTHGSWYKSLLSRKWIPVP